MHALLKNSLRMRPDRVMVGEIRGSEAETLFVAMDIGLEGSMGTIHANNARETTIRLMDEPMNVPVRMIPLVDLIVVTNRIYDRTRGLIRRVTQVSEVAGIEKDVVQLGDIYNWDVKTDAIKRTEYPILLTETLSEKCGISKKRLNKEFMIREKVLEYMMKQNIRNHQDVLYYFQKYHKNPKEIIDQIKETSNLNHEEKIS
jgi:flagellar protein FlaI